MATLVVIIAQRVSSVQCWKHSTHRVAAPLEDVLIAPVVICTLLSVGVAVQSPLRQLLFYSIIPQLLHMLPLGSLHVNTLWAKYI